MNFRSSTANKNCEKKDLVVKKRICFQVCSSIVLLIAVSVCVYGQTYQSFRLELQQISQNARWRFGPFRIDPSIRLQNIGYDNNVYQMREEDDPIGDYTTSISLPFTFYLPYRNWMIAYVDVNPGYDIYFNEKQLSGFVYSYTPGVRMLLLNRFVLSGSYYRQKSRRRPTVEFDRMIPVETEGYDGSLFLETFSMTAIGFSGSVSNIRYQDVAGDIRYSSQLNREERNGKLEFYYRVFTDSDFFLTAGYTEYNFDSPESQWRDSYSYEVLSGIRFPLLGRARGTLSLGYRWLINRADDDRRFSGLIGDTGIELRLGRFNLRLQFARDFQFSYYSTNLYFTGNRYGFGISFYPAQFLRLDYDFSYGQTDYPGGEPVALPEGIFADIAREDIYRSHSAGLVFRIRENVGIGLTVTYWERDSNVGAYGRNRTFIGGYLTYDF